MRRPTSGSSESSKLKEFGGSLQKPPYEKLTCIEEGKKMKIDDEELRKELEDMGFIPTKVTILPECASFIEFDHHGNEIWKGISGREYMIIK